MKKIIALFFTSMIFISCDTENTANVSSITNYPLIELNGADPFFVVTGGAYADPGAIATEGGNIIPFVTTASSSYRGSTTIDTTKPDKYTQTYTATNKDGFKASAERTVHVYKNGDLVNSIEGIYISSLKRNGSGSAQYQNMKYVYIWKNVDGTYGISDAFGGWYEFGRGLGTAYGTPGGIINAVNIATNTFTFPGTQTTNTFGGTSEIKSLTVNPVTKTLVLTTEWSFGFTFVATLVQFQP